MFRRFSPMVAIALAFGLAPAPGRAQTNIDQGKSPAEIFAQDCATCHRSARGLANGRSSATLAGFLVEHYTSSRDQAAQLAAYVMGAGGGEPAAATQGRGPKPVGPERGRAALDEAKPAPALGRSTGKPEENRPATAKLQPPAVDETKRPPTDVPSVVQEPPPAPAVLGHRPAANRRDLQPTTATRGRNNKREPDYSPPRAEPAAVVAEPSSAGSPAQEVSPSATPSAATSAAAPANNDSGAPVPRDDIPD